MKWNFRFVSGGTQNLCGLFNAFTVLFYEFFFGGRTKVAKLIIRVRVTTTLEIFFY